MAFPTTYLPKPTSPVPGLTPIGQVDATARHLPGFTATFNDATYGEVECIYLAGVASTAVGDTVVFDPKAGTTTRTVAASRGPVAVALAANTSTTAYAWYAIRGMVPVNTTAAGTGAANALLCTTATAGQTTVSGTANQKIDGAVCKSTQGAPGTGFTDVLLDYPAANGNT